VVLIGNPVQFVSRKGAKGKKESGATGNVVVRYPAQSLIEFLTPKIDQQAEGQIHKPQTCQQLLAVNRQECIDRFYFDDQAIVHHQIRPESVGENKIINLNFDRHLPINFQTASDEPLFQHRFVNRFQQSWSDINV
jgi:hypothetical protein